MYAYTISVNSGCDLQAQTCSGIALCMQVQVMLTMQCAIGVLHVAMSAFHR